MGSRPWRRTGVPPMPALIPIAAIRAKHQDQPANNNTATPSCGPCGQRCSHGSGDRASDQDEKDRDSGDRELTDEVRKCNGVRGSGSGRGVEQRSLRRPTQTDDAEPIDEAASRDGSGPQAPARRARPERHRKSDRRRHRSDRLLRKRSTSGSTTSSACSVSSGHSTTRRQRQQQQQQQQQQHHQQQQQEQQQRQCSDRPTSAPRVNPIFVWVRQEDTRIVDVRCEDYDKRNRILLTKTAHGWRAIPRTETLATTIEEQPASSQPANSQSASSQPASSQPANASEQRPARKARSRKSGKTKRCRPSAATPDYQEAEQERLPSPAVSPRPEEPLSWSAPVNVESHLPSHTIPVPRRSPEGTVLADSSGSVSVNSGEAHASECCAVSDVSSPLDNLLAVAELEFKQHQEAAAELPADSCASDKEDYDIDQLNTLAEVSSEEVADIESDKPEQEQEDEPHSEDCDYNEDDENHMAMTDILERLEQSLQSPMVEENDHVEEEEEEVDDCTSYLQEEDRHEMGDDQADQEEISEEQQDLVPEETIEQEEQEESKCEEAGEDQVIMETEYESEKTEIIQQEESSQPTDLSVKDTSLNDKAIEDVSEDEMPTDLSTHSQKQPVAEEVEEVQEDDMQPTDLSIRKHSNTSPALRIETPRPPSQNSETIQSPQPSGIPAVPPSPDIFSHKQNSKSLFLETLLSSASPKLALTPEVTITRNPRHQEPLDLGKSRKSASPTVSCSEEAKNKFADGEPASKRVKIEDITLKNLLHADKQKPEVKTPEETKPERRDSQNSNVESSRLLELLTSDNEPDPITQLKQILADTELNVPDPLLVPKERLSQILSSPAREIPRLLSQRPELRLPEALAYPQLLQDPDILVITLTQLQTILQKQNQPIAVQEPKPKESKPAEKPAPKPSSKPAKSEASNNSFSNDYLRYTNAAGLQHQQQLLEAQMKQQKEALNGVRPPNGLAGDIDAATTAAFNQMLWLPYLNQLEAAAVACGNNTEFLKALNTVFPPTSTSYPTPQMPEMPPLFGATSGGFGRMSGAPFPPVQPSIDYGNPLEMAMWQEAMMQANMQRPKHPSENSMKHAAYRESMERAAMMNNAKKYHAGAARVHSSARTSPISHTFHQQRIPTTGHSAMPNPFMHASYSVNSGRHNLQIPQYNPSLSQQQQAMLQHQQQAAAVAAAAAAARNSRPPVPTYRNNNHMSKSEAKQQNHAYKYSQYMNRDMNREMSQQKVPTSQQQTKESSPGSQKPRVTCKSLQNLLSPNKREEAALKRLSAAEEAAQKRPQEQVTRPNGTQPMDLSGSKQHPFMSSKLKVKQNLLDPAASFGAKLWRHEDVPEVGSTTEEMTSTHLHETQTHLWHPLFGK